MADPAALLLAAGLSRRFGGPGKLLADWRGNPLALHAADTLAGLPLRRRVAVCRAGDAELARLLSARGFDIVANPDPGRGLSSSLALGIRALVAADAVMVALADMPRVSSLHLRRLIEAACTAPIVASTSGGGAPTPPAIFARQMFPALLALEGDTGARDLLHDATLVTAPAGELVDVDTLQDLADTQSPPSQ